MCINDNNFYIGRHIAADFQKMWKKMQFLEYFGRFQMKIDIFSHKHRLSLYEEAR